MERSLFSLPCSPPLPHLHPLSCLPRQTGCCWGLAGPDVGGGRVATPRAYVYLGLSQFLGLGLGRGPLRVERGTTDLDLWVTPQPVDLSHGEEASGTCPGPEGGASSLQADRGTQVSRRWAQMPEHLPFKS